MQRYYSCFEIQFGHANSLTKQNLYETVVDTPSKTKFKLVDLYRRTREPHAQHRFHQVPSNGCSHTTVQTKQNACCLQGCFFVSWRVHTCWCSNWSRADKVAVTLVFPSGHHVFSLRGMCSFESSVAAWGARPNIPFVRFKEIKPGHFQFSRMTRACRLRDRTEGQTRTPPKR